jgi:hypothetical protein
MTTKNPAKDALGQWRAVPEKLPRAWHNKVTPYARFIGLELYRRCDDAYQGIVQVGTPWMDDVCRQLEIDGTHRKALKTALSSLVSKGLIKVFDGYIFVDFGQQGEVANRARIEPNSNHTQTSVELGPNQKQIDDRENIEIASPRVGKDKGRVGRESGDEPESCQEIVPALLVQSSLPAAIVAPPSIPDEPGLNRFIRVEYGKRYIQLWGAPPVAPSAFKVDQVAKLAIASANAQETSPEELVLRTLDSLFATKNENVIRFKHALGCILTQPAEFMGRRQLAKVQPLDPTLQDKRSEARPPIADRLLGVAAASGGQR